MDDSVVHPFSTVLVANRGEIALRVIRACREAGLRTVAVWSDADREAPHVREADLAVRVGPAAASQSYLSIDALLHAAEVSGADAVHPGYGFLSERAEFARRVTEAGLVFIGPSAQVMESMGRKDHAREIAERAGVPVTPRFDLSVGFDLSVDGHDAAPQLTRPGTGSSAVAAAADAYPVLVKAAAGGGGKGMRIVRTPGDLADAVAAAGREAASAFGDDTLLIERYVEHGRHVEVQVVGDHHGNVVHLFERDCSVQRRHQKVLEEAPAPTISAAVRETLLTSAVALAREVGYVNAGTVEFLVAADEVFFLEMNTRLQVEHPVTEAVTGRDIVRLQLDVAAGRPLGFAQADVTCSGHAIEARVYAEDPYAGFLPQAGRADIVRWPSPSRARVDAALDSGDTVTTAYDPMLGKIIVHAPTREAARLSLVAALDDTAVVGLTTNVGFLQALASSRAYADAAIDTAWLDHDPAGAAAVAAPGVPPMAEPLAAWVLARVTARDDARDPFGTADGWRAGGPPAPVPVTLQRAGSTSTWQVDPTTGVVTGQGTRTRIALVERSDTHVRVDVDGIALDTTVAVDQHAITVVLHGQPWVFTRPDAFGPAASSVLAEREVVAPMPGTVLSVEVGQGDEVSEGQTLGVMEAMKMELALKAPYAGTVGHVGAAAGDQVALRHVLFTVDPVGA
ncbi:MAG: biotin carboxylase N-terminal domain-containing protein [Nocardioidaceae bacterium]